MSDDCLRLDDLEPPETPYGIADLAAGAGIARVGIVAWRDEDHPEAGGSEAHASRIAERWGAAGLDVTLTASRPPGGARTASARGYQVIRPAGRYGVFPAAAAMAVSRRAFPPDATLEVWNGMPFFSPLWARRARGVFLHHVHEHMWDLVLPRHLAAIGRFVECRVAPPFYRGTPVMTPSASSRETIIERLRLHPDQVRVIAPGVDERFVPGHRRQDDPLVVAAGRLVPYKGFDQLIEVLVSLKARHPRLSAVIAGEGYHRPALEALVDRHQAQDWLYLPGRIDDGALVQLFQRAWVLLAGSAYEGWGLTITEAAACATPAVASGIAGHIDAIYPGVSGLIARPGVEMVDAVDMLISNDVVRRRMQIGALDRAKLLSWDQAAVSVMQVLADDARNRLGIRAGWTPAGGTRVERELSRGRLIEAPAE